MAVIGYIFTAFIGVVIGGLIKGWNSYSEEKFRNLATKEDFKDLKIQTSELREATKEIEAKIDDQLWNKQRLWEMKRDALIEAAKRLSVAHSAISGWAAVKTLEYQNPQTDWLKEHSDQIHKWVAAHEELALSVALTEVVSSHETIAILRKTLDHLNLLHHNITEGKLDCAPEFGELNELIKDARRAIRSELHNTDSIMFLSVGRSMSEGAPA